MPPVRSIDDPDAIAEAIERLTAGELVAIPTETVYGLAARADREDALAKIFAAKGRPKFDPLICHIAGIDRIDDVAVDVPEAARKLAAAFWPGPLTVVLPKRDHVPDLATAGLATVGVRVPGCEPLRKLLERLPFPLAAPSANRFGRISPTTAGHVVEQFAEPLPEAPPVALVLDGGPAGVGVESAIVDAASDPPRLLRPGGTPLEELRAVLPELAVAEPTSDPASQAGPQVSPGRLKSHYAPRTPLYLVDEPAGSFSQRVGILTFEPMACCAPVAAAEALSESGDLAEAAANLFAAMRRLDAAGLDAILAVPVPEEGLGRAINDRLRRAASE